MLSARSVSPASGGSGDEEKGRSRTEKSKSKHNKQHRRGRGKSGSSGSDSDTGKRRSKQSGRKKARSLYFREGDEGKIIRILELKKDRLRNIDVESVSQVCIKNIERMPFTFLTKSSLLEIAQK